MSALRPFVLSFGTVGIGKILQVGLLALLARRMDVASFGALGLLINASQIGAYLHAAGLSNGATRLIAAFDVQGHWGALAGFLRFGLKLLASTTLLALIAGTVVVAAGWMDSFEGWYVIALTVISGIGIARAAFSLGFHDVVGALLPREVLAPAAAVVTLLLLAGLSPQDMFVIYLGSFVLAELVGAVLLLRKIPTRAKAALPRQEPWEWLKVLVPLQAIALMTIALQRIDLIVVGFMFDLRTVALYAAAQRVAQLLSVLARVNGFAVAPQIARAYHSGDRAAVWRAVWFNVLLGALIGVPVCLVLTLAAAAIMGLFGGEYAAGTDLLVTLAIGQLVSAVLAPMTQVLTMTAFERKQMRLLAVLCAAALPTLWLAGLWWGAVGVAICSTVLWSANNLGALGLALRNISRTPAPE